jgi:hypothetical protein
LELSSCYLPFSSKRLLTACLFRATVRAQKKSACSAERKRPPRPASALNSAQSLPHPERIPHKQRMNVKVKSPYIQLWT